jgi:hypothetical protein
MKQQAESLAHRGWTEKHSGKNRDKEDRQEPALSLKASGIDQLFNAEILELPSRRA